MVYRHEKSGVKFGAVLWVDWELQYFVTTCMTTSSGAFTCCESWRRLRNKFLRSTNRCRYQPSQKYSTLLRRKLTAMIEVARINSNWKKVSGQRTCATCIYCSAGGVCCRFLDPVILVLQSSEILATESALREYHWWAFRIYAHDNTRSKPSDGSWAPHIQCEWK